MSTAKKILIVDDEVPLRNDLRIKLTGEDFDVLEAKNGEEGLEIALREHPDLILLDIIMPVMDGMSMLKRVRANAWGKKANVIMLTNLSDNERVAEAVTHGQYEYLVKSDWKIEDIVAKIKERLGE